jgi:type IV pilus assembly protein PilC
MATQPRVFPPLDVMLVRAGDISGNLPETLKMLADWYEFRHRLRRVVTSNMVLPVAILHVAALIGPLPTFFLSDMGGLGYLRAVLTWLLPLYLPAAVVLAIVRLTPKAGILRKILDGFVAMVPILGVAVRNFALSRFCWAFHMLLKAGVPIVGATEMATDAAGNWTVAKLVGGGADAARSGHPVSEGLSRRLGREFLDVWEVGEETGTLDEAARRLAVMTGQSAEGRFRALVVWVPRIVYFLVMLRIAMEVLRMGYVITRTTLLTP